MINPMTIKIMPQLPSVMNKGLNSASITIKILKIKKPTPKSGFFYFKWSRRESNPRPNKQLQCFLHA